MPTGEIGRLFYTLGIDTKEFDAKIEAAKTKVDSFSSRIVQVGDRVGAFGRKMSDFSAQMTRYVTLPIAGVGVASHRMAEQFDDAMDKIAGLVGISEKQLKAWEDDLKRISEATARPLTEVAEGLFFITSAGLRGKKAIEALEASAMAATIGLGDMKTVADAVTSAVNAYSRRNMKAKRATEILTAAVRMGKLEASTLAPVFGRILPTAAALDVAFEDVAGTIAVMSRTGTDAAEAVTSLTAIFSAFLKPSKEAQKTLAQVGLKFSDLREMLKQPGGVIEVMRLLDERFAGNEEALARVIPNVRAFRGAMNVLAQEQDVVNEVMKGVRDSTGILDDAFKKTTDDTFFKFRQAIEKVKNSLITLGGVLAETLAPVVDNSTKIIDNLRLKFEALGEETKKQYVTYALLIAIAGPLVWIFGKLITIIGGLLTAFGFLIKAATSLKIVFALLAKNPLVAALGVIVFFLYRAYAAFQKAREGGNSLVAALFKASRAANPLLAALDAIKSALRRAFNFAVLNIDPFRNFINRVIFYINNLIEAWNRSPLGRLLKGRKIEYVGKQRRPERRVRGFREFQSGGIVKYPTLALIGEKEPEAVIPLSKLSKFRAQTASIEVIIRPTAGAEQLVETVVKRITRREARVWK